ncbi:hypothetical protein KAR48_13765 [bacterium]|nr:hypothetical protein [bacterium]
MSHFKIGLRHEDKSRWERRTAITPTHIRHLVDEYGIECIVQPSPTRIFTDGEYAEAGATIQSDLSSCQVVFGLKEMPAAIFEKGKTYIFFSHTIKGQAHNMPMLKRLADLECTLLDYEKIEDDNGRRLLFFGRFAGLAGMIDSLWSLGERLKYEGYETPFEKVGQAFHYSCLEDAETHIREAAELIARDGLPMELGPIVIGFTGYGHVSGGAQEIFDILPHKVIQPEDLEAFINSNEWDPRYLYKVVYREEDMNAPKDAHAAFKLQEYYDHPERYKSIFAPHLQWLSVMINAIYWDTPYPKLVTKQELLKLFKASRRTRLKLIGDITCDIDGSVEPTVRATQPDNPTYVYDPFDDTHTDGFEGRGVVILPVDNFPCELPRESSMHFADGLFPYIEEIAKACYTKPLEELGFSNPIKHSTLLHRGKLTPNFEYLNKYL